MNNGTKKLPKIQRIYRRTVSKIFRDTLLRAYPRIDEREHYWPLLTYLLFPTQVVQGKTLLARDTIADLFGYSSIPPSFNTGRMFKGFAEAIQEFTWSDYSKFEKRARVVQNLDWPKQIQEALEHEHKRLFWKEGRVYLITGKPFSQKKQYQFMRDERMQALQLASKTKETQMLLDYMNNVSNHLFANLIKRNGGRTLDVILNLESDIAHQWNIFSSIIDDYNQLYQPADKTVRIFPFGERIVSLKSEVRKTLTHGLLEGDLKSAQFAIAGTLWNVPSVKKFLSEGGDMWKYLYQLGIPDKDKLKKILYSLMFGMHHVGTIAQLNEIGIRYKDFVGLPLIRDLLQARNKEMKRISDERGATTCFGQYLPITEVDPKLRNKQIRSILAQCCQAMELKLLLPVTELANENKGQHGFTIALWQHDGFTLHCHSSVRLEHWKWLIGFIVKNTAKANGIETQLQWQEI